MPYKDPEKYRAYQRMYRRRLRASDPEFAAREREATRLRIASMRLARLGAARTHLGDRCAECGALPGDGEGRGGGYFLEFDHVDPSAKEFDVASQFSVSEERFWAEIAKCQLLCLPCHTAKTFGQVAA